MERAAQGGRWKVNNCETLEVGGVAVGRKFTMNFYEHIGGDNDLIWTNWGMQEFARIIGPNKEVFHSEIHF